MGKVNKEREKKLKQKKGGEDSLAPLWGVCTNKSRKGQRGDLQRGAEISSNMNKLEHMEKNCWIRGNHNRITKGGGSENWERKKYHFLKCLR